MGLTDRLRRLFRRSRTSWDSVIWEATPRCNLACIQCYNVWKDDAPYPPGELSTAAGLTLIETVIKKTGCREFTFTGGEPCLREDLEALAARAVALGCSVSLITNGTLLGARRIESLMDAGIRLFELPLNSSDRATHDRMAGMAGAFDRVTRAGAEISSRGGDLAFVFVSTTQNRGHFAETLDLGIALGAVSFLYNRYNGGGACHADPGRLMPSIEDLHADLTVAQDMAATYGLAIGASIAMPPCLIEQTRFPNVGFGFCAAGTSAAYHTVDPLGNVRPCNHTPTIIGNIFEDSTDTMAASPMMQAFVGARPGLCAGCALEEECLGGCKAAGEVCYGSVTQPDPFLRLNEGRMVRPISWP